MSSSVRITFWFVFVCSTALNPVCGKCKHVLERGVKGAERQLIVDKHNEFRQMVSKGKVPGQPKGKNLKLLKWDLYLAYRAQQISDSCDFKHRNVDDKRFYVGQNLYTHGHSNYIKGPMWDKAIQNWFDEHKAYHYPNPSSKTGHYTQVIWAETEYIGCGYTCYHEGRFYQKLYVCNYGPGGNMRGEAPYKVRK